MSIEYEELEETYAGEDVKISWHGHSCFKIEHAGHSIVIDPYREVTGYPSLFLTAGEVYCTHGHDDHNFVQAVRIVEESGNSPFKVTTMPAFHDIEGGRKRGKNNIFIIEVAGKRLVHMGDLGHDLTPGNVAKLAGADVLMIPVGGFFTIDAATAASLTKRIDAAITIPMHYRSGQYGYEVIADVEDYLALIDDRPVIRAEGSELLLDKKEKADTKKSVVRLKFA